MMTIILMFVGMLMMAMVNLVIMVLGLASSKGARTPSTDLGAERLQRGQKAKTLRLCDGDVAFCQQLSLDSLKQISTIIQNNCLILMVNIELRGIS